MPATQKKKTPSKRTKVDKIFRYRQTYSLGNLSVYGETDSLPGGASCYQFRLADLPDGGLFSSLYDEYRITRVKLHFVPTANMSAIINATEPPGGTNPGYFIPNVHTAITYSTAQIPTASSQLMQATTYRRFLMDKERTITLVPKWSIGSVQPGLPLALFGHAPSTEWATCSDPGLKWGNVPVWVDPVSTGSVALNPCQIRIYAEVDVEFRNVI